MGTIETADADLREVDKMPFGIYAISLLLLLSITAAGLDIMRLRLGLPSVLLQRVHEYLYQSTTLTGLSFRFITDSRLLLAMNVAIILVLAAIIVGLWLRLREAWILAIIVTGIGLVYNIWLYLEDTPQYINMAVNVAAVFYLNERSVKRAFEHRPSGATDAARRTT